MLMYKLIEYSHIYSKTSRSLWKYYRDELNDTLTDSESYTSKIKITGIPYADGKTKNVEITVPLKYLRTILENPWNATKQLWNKSHSNMVINLRHHQFKWYRDICSNRYKTLISSCDFINSRFQELNSWNQVLKDQLTGIQISQSNNRKTKPIFRSLS